MNLLGRIPSAYVVLDSREVSRDQESMDKDSIWKHGQDDFKAMLHTFWFWAADVGGGAVLGAVFENPWVGVIYIFGFAIAVWLGATASALFKQRNEARQFIEDTRIEKSKPSSWVSLEDALQYIYDALPSGAYDASGQLGPMISDLGRDSSDLWDHVGAWVIDGIEKGEISARGRIGHQTALNMIPVTIDIGRLQGCPNRCAEDDRGRVWEIVDVRRSTIDVYLEGLTDD